MWTEMCVQKLFRKAFQRPFQRGGLERRNVPPFQVERGPCKTTVKTMKDNGKMRNVPNVPDPERRSPFHTPRFLNGGGRNDWNDTWFTEVSA